MPQFSATIGRFAFALSIAWWGGVSLARAGAAPAAAPEVPPPALPAIESIELEPKELTIDHARDARQVLVWGIATDGRRFDMVRAPYGCSTPAGPGWYVSD